MSQQESDLVNFDQRESMRGYQAGLTGQSCPHDASRWYRNGWENGREDYETLQRLSGFEKDKH